jgi:hypothetical protein
MASGKDNNTILTIPLIKLKDESEFYIRIPCNGPCNLMFYYNYDDGRKIEGITIEDNSCYDIYLTKYDGIEDYTYRFVNYVVKKNYPSITFTTTSTRNFTLLVVDSEEIFLQDNFFNGYSFIYRYDEAYYEYNTFILQPFDNMTFHVCHRTVPDNEEQYKDISVGEEIYSTLKNFKNGIFDCFRIENSNEYERYMINYVTKTKNLFIHMKSKINETIKSHLFTEQTGNLMLESNTEFFCFEINKKWNEDANQHAFSSINFHLLGVNKNKEITQKYNLPLKNGVSLLQNLEKGQILYYRLNEYIPGSNYLFLHFQKIHGNVKVYKGICDYIPECYFDEYKIMNDNLEEINYFYEGNIYLKEDIKNKTNIDQKNNVPVYVVYCFDALVGSSCNYSIELNNEETNIVVNQHIKFYSFIEQNDTETAVSNRFITFTNIVIYLSEKYLIFFEVHLISGQITDFYLNGNHSNENFTQYDGKTFYFVKDGRNSGFTPFVIEFLGKNKSFFYINYFYADNADENEKSRTTPYIFSENEMHYNLMRKRYFYSFSENSKDGEYIISLSSINADLTMTSSQGSIFGRHSQVKTDNNGELRVYCFKDGYTRGSKFKEQACEFVASAAKLTDNTINKNIEFDGFYQFYILDDDVKTINLYYYFREEEIKSKMILVNIKKSTLDTLKIEYGFNKTEDLEQKLIYKYNEIFIIDITNITKNLDEGYDLENILNKTNYFFIRITKEKSDNNYIEFKIKTNIKNVPTYLSNDGIDLGYLKPNEYRSYYFEYGYTDASTSIQDLYMNILSSSFCNN